VKSDPDGSVTVLTQKERPTDTSNWLPASKEPVNLTIRTYGSQKPILDCSYWLYEATLGSSGLIICHRRPDSGTRRKASLHSFVPGIDQADVFGGIGL
jgi:hypothetical protein